MNDLSLPTALSSEALRFIRGLFGGLPHPAEAVRTQAVHSLCTPNHRLQIWVLRTEKPYALAWHLTLLMPLASGQRDVPVLLSPDGCWPHVVSSEAGQAVGAEDVALAHFDRLYFAHDRDDGLRQGALYDQQHDAPWGAISAWAWALKTTVQGLISIPGLNAEKIGVIGHSRGGKAALLAGAITPQVALTVAHNSGCAGAASFQAIGNEAETLAAMQARFPHWLSDECKQADVRTDLAALDNTALLHSFTGRHLCVMQADDDLWANPEGTRYAVDRLRADWHELGLANRLHHMARSGGHSITALDWGRAAQTLSQIQR